MKTPSALKAGLASILLALAASSVLAHPHGSAAPHRGYADGHHYHQHDSRAEQRHLRMEQARERARRAQLRQWRHEHRMDRHHVHPHAQPHGAVVIVPAQPGRPYYR